MFVVVALEVYFYCAEERERVFKADEFFKACLDCWEEVFCFLKGEVFFAYICDRV